MTVQSSPTLPEKVITALYRKDCFGDFALSNQPFLLSASLRGEMPAPSV